MVNKYQQLNPLKHPYLFGLMGTSVVLITALVGFLDSAYASTAQLSLSSVSSITTGSDFTVSINLAAGGTNVDTAQVALTYPSSQLSCVTTANTSDFTVAPQADSCSGGNVLIQRGRSSNYSADASIATITFKALVTGSPVVQFTNSTKLYYQGTPVTFSATNATYDITSPPASPTSSGSGSSGSTNSSSTSATTKSSVSSSTTSKASASKSTTSATSTTTNPPATNVTPTNTPVLPALAITKLQVSGISDTTATVSWQTNQPATSSLGYSLDHSYSLSAGSNGLSTNHSLSLSAEYLQPGLTYYVKVTSTNSSGSTVTQTTSFQSPGFDIAIQVLYGHNQLLSGALVTIDKQTEKTNSSGQASFQNLPAGNQTVVIKDGTKTTQQAITVGKRNPKTGSFEPQEFSLTAAKGTNTNLTVVIVFILIAMCLGLAYQFKGYILNRLKQPANQHRLMTWLTKRNSTNPKPRDVDLTTVIPSTPVNITGLNQVGTGQDNVAGKVETKVMAAPPDSFPGSVIKPISDENKKQVD